MGDEGFNVTEDYQLEDMSEVKEDKVVLPATSNVLFRIQTASQRTSKDGSIKSVSAQLNLVVGLDVPERNGAGEPTGQLIKKWVNKPLFVDLPYWADTKIRTSERYTGKNQAFKVPLKQFLVALGYDLKNPPKLGDEFYGTLIGRELRGDIKLREVQVKSEQGEWKGTGEFVNEVKNFKPA